MSSRIIWWAAMSVAIVGSCAVADVALAQPEVQGHSCELGCEGSSSDPGTSYTPTPEDPEAAARREEEARQNAAALEAAIRAAEAEYDASVDLITRRETRGRDIVAVYERFQEALARATSDAAIPRTLMARLPSRARTPIGALEQVGCAAFHSSLALSIQAWDDTVLPKRDVFAIDAERVAFEASTVFDRGEAIPGCGAMASVPLRFMSTRSQTSSPPSSGDPKADATVIGRALQDMKNVGETLRLAQASYAAADAEYRKAKADREAGELARQAEAERIDRERNDRDGRLRAAEAERKRADAEVTRTKSPMQKAHELFEQMVAKQVEAQKIEDAAKEEKKKGDAAAKVATDKAKADAKEQADREEAARKRAAEEARARDEAQAKDEAAKALAAESATKLDTRAGKRGNPYYLPRPRPVRPRLERAP